MIHEQMNVELGNAASLCNCTVRLSQIVAPFRQCLAGLLMFGQVAAGTIGWENPILRLGWIQHPPQPQDPYEAQNHRPGKWNIERLGFPTLRPWHV